MVVMGTVSIELRMLSLLDGAMGWRILRGLYTLEH